MTREFIKGQQIEYYVMMAIELGCKQGYWIKHRLDSEFGIKYSMSQISGALQRLKKQGIVFYDGKWSIVN